MLLVTRKGRPQTRTTLSVVIGGYTLDSFAINTLVGQNITILHRDGIERNYNLSAGLTNISEGGMGSDAGTVLITIPDREAITRFGAYFLYGLFPNLSDLTNLTFLSLLGATGLDYSATNLLALQVRLLSLEIKDGWNISSSAAQSFLFGLTRLENILFAASYIDINIANHDVINALTSLKTVSFTACLGTTTPALTNLSALHTLTYTGAGTVDNGGLLGNVIDKLPNSIVLKTINYSNNNMVSDQIDIMVDKLHAWAAANNNNDVVINIGGTNASPTGTYDGTTDWDAGLPISPKAMLWDLVNNRNWSITYTL